MSRSSASDAEHSAGWHLRGDVAYSPVIESLDSLQFQRDGLDVPGYDEWYVFQGMRDLGQVFDGNYFDFRPDCGQIMVFVNSPAFVLHHPNPYLPGILEIFWNQLILIEPETFIADGDDHFTLVSKDVTLVDQFQKRLAADSMDHRCFGRAHQDPIRVLTDWHLDPAP
jgi:hypothetical protein